MSYGRMGDGIASVFSAMFIGLCIFVPLGVWKLVDIIIWLCHHISVSVK